MIKILTPLITTLFSLSLPTLPDHHNLTKKSRLRCRKRDQNTSSRTNLQRHRLRANQWATIHWPLIKFFQPSRHRLFYPRWFWHYRPRKMDHNTQNRHSRENKKAGQKIWNLPQTRNREQRNFKISWQVSPRNPIQFWCYEWRCSMDGSSRWWICNWTMYSWWYWCTDG